MYMPFNDEENNMVPCQRAINNYKWRYSLLYFRITLLGKLHLRLKKYPYSGNGGERRRRMEKIAAYFDITPDRPLSGNFFSRRCLDGYITDKKEVVRYDSFR